MVFSDVETISESIAVLNARSLKALIESFRGRHARYHR